MNAARKQAVMRYVRSGGFSESTIRLVDEGFDGEGEFDIYTFGKGEFTRTIEIILAAFDAGREQASQELRDTIRELKALGVEQAKIEEVVFG